MSLARIVFVSFLAQQFWTNSNAAYFDFEIEVLIPSCKDHGIAGETLQTDCVEYCYPNRPETYDYADMEEDPNYVVRNTVCRCFEDSFESPSAQARKAFECTTKAEVWDKKTPTMRCAENYNITSLTTCQDFCKMIDPKAYEYSGYSGNSRCNCGNVEVCDDSTSSAAIATTMHASITFSIAVGFMMITAL